MARAHPRSAVYLKTWIMVALATIALFSYLAWRRNETLKSFGIGSSTFSSGLEEDAIDDVASNGDKKEMGGVGTGALQPAPSDNTYMNYPAGPLDGAEDLVVVVKTGATEIYRSLTIQLTTTLTHTPNYLIFSDHEQQIAQYKIQDALDEVSETTIAGNKDFELYLEQKKIIAMGQSPEHLELKGGWDLDKYKNIHMMKKTWQQRPNMKWYLFIDADSYPMLSNLLPYLRGLDHTKKLYLGDVYEIDGIKFGQGGTGYVLSHGAMQYVMERDPDMPHRFEEMAKEKCCGDQVLGAMLKEHGIPLSETFPNFCGEGPGRIGFSPENHCQPVVTMHHMSPAEISEMWTFERRLAQPGQYILFKDIFDHFIWPNLSDEYDAWDGLSPIHGAGVEVPPELFEAMGRELSATEKKERLWTFCERTCQSKGESECLQFQIQKDECRIFKGIAMGYKLPVTKEDRDEYRSGWLLDRVEKLKNITCDQPGKTWPKDVVAGA